MKEKDIKAEKQKAKKKFNLKTYLKDFYLFIYKHLRKTTVILIIISIILCAISFNPLYDAASMVGEEQTYSNESSLLYTYCMKLQTIVIMPLTGIAPYIYAPLVGVVLGTLSEVYNLVYVIKDYGTFLGTVLSFIPFILNILLFAITGALGVYICNMVTLGQRISNMKNMNWYNFKCEIYRALNKQDKLNSAKKKRQQKMDKLCGKKEKVQYVQILNTLVVVAILQLVSVIIEKILM